MVVVCSLRGGRAARNSNGIVIVGVFPCIRLADSACGCPLRLVVVSRSGIEFCCKHDRSYIL